MIRNLKQTLNRTQKYKLWQQAYIFNVCQQVVSDFLEEKGMTQGRVKVFLKIQTKSLKLTLATKDSTFVSWLMTSRVELEKVLVKKLNETEALGERSLDLHFKSG